MEALNPVEECRSVIKRAAWRLQYRSRSKLKKEIIGYEEFYSSQPSFESEIISKIYLDQIEKSIETIKGKYVFKRIIVDGATEKETSKELKISQQAVNKWKKKTIKELMDKKETSINIFPLQKNVK